MALRFVRLARSDGKLLSINPDLVTYFEHVGADQWRLHFSTTSLDIRFPGNAGSVEGDRGVLEKFLKG